MKKEIMKSIIDKYNTGKMGIKELHNEHGEYELYLYVVENRDDENDWIGAINESIFPFGNTMYDLKPMSRGEVIAEIEDFIRRNITNKGLISSATFNLNVRPFDYIRNGTKEEQWEFVKDEIEEMSNYTKTFTYGRCGNFAKCADFLHYKEKILSDIDTFIECNLNEDIFEEDQWNCLESELESEYRDQFPLNFEGDDWEFSFQNAEHLANFLKERRTRGFFAILTKDKILLPTTDRGGGIIDHDVLTRKI